MKRYIECTFLDVLTNLNSIMVYILYTVRKDQIISDMMTLSGL